MFRIKKLLNIDQLEDDTESSVHEDTNDALETDNVLLRPVAGLPTDTELAGVLKYVFFHIIYRQGLAEAGKIFFHMNISVISQVLPVAFPFPQLVSCLFAEAVREGFLF